MYLDTVKGICYDLQKLDYLSSSSNFTGNPKNNDIHLLVLRNITQWEKTTPKVHFNNEKIDGIFPR